MGMALGNLVQSHAGRVRDFGIITAVTITNCPQRVPLSAGAPINTNFAQREAFKAMGIAKGSRLQCAVAVVCLLAAFLTGCSRDPNARKQKLLESGQKYLDKGQPREAEIQFQ